MAWFTTERLAIIAIMMLAFLAGGLCMMGRLSEQATIAIVGGTIGALSERYLRARRYGALAAPKTRPSSSGDSDPPEGPQGPGAGLGAAAGMMIGGMLAGGLGVPF